MKTVYKILGLLGIIAYITVIFIVAGSKMETVSKTAIIISSSVNIVVCSVLIAVSFLMEDTSALRKKISTLESYIMSNEKDKYLAFINNCNTPINKIQKSENSTEKVQEGVKLLELGEYSRAFSIFKEAADSGDTSSFSYVGTCYMMGYGSIVDKNIAIEYFEKAVDAGDPDGMYLLGLAYKNGDGVMKNEIEAKRLILAAASNGSIKAEEYIKKHNFN